MNTQFPNPEMSLASLAVILLLHLYHAVEGYNNGRLAETPPMVRCFLLL